MIATLALLAWAYLLLLHGRFWQSGPELAPAVPRVAPEIAIVVPARDEAGTIAASIGSLLAQDYPGRFRVVLVDDGSTDGTGDIARALPGAERLTVICGTPRPAGWAGKLWAVQQGVAAANAELVSAATTPPQAPAPAPATPWYSKKIAGNFTTGEAGILAVTAGVLWRVFA